MSDENQSENDGEVFYGVKRVQRPKVKATRVLDLSGENGRRIVITKANEILKLHEKTFAKLADM
ncbi:acetyltransferase [Litorivicinus lipolyticus]|uniref:Acetyltransferase n=1 Tax=Litorivicinus lipolyticus TaxID=418701 RepID=A0A5Q2QB81_9GAMM|nr:acetyltransferase [Litorivicinus lipolyticus]QGG79070.1 acetyltransferase [Litorivicinus lipolyticus]